jgi:LysM repeat protein
VDETVLVEGELYVVQDGDNLWDIAQSFGITVDAIVAANEMENPEDLQLGQELVIPAAEEEAAISEAVE